MTRGSSIGTEIVTGVALPTVTLGGSALGMIDATALATDGKASDRASVTRMRRVWDRIAGTTYWDRFMSNDLRGERDRKAWLSAPLR
jgi:hypothetical protein